MHGYDLRKRLRSGVGLLGSLSFGSLYPALARLERSGAVREVDPAESLSAAVIPLTGSLSGEKAAFRARLAARAAFTAGAARATARSAAGTRGRRVYELTAAGDKLFESLLAQDSVRSDQDRAFLLRWSFARHMTGERRLDLLESQRRHVRERLVTARTATASPQLPGDRYACQVAEHTVDSLARELAWIEHLITTEQNGSAYTRTETDVS